jgi:hypothetical protein
VADRERTIDESEQALCGEADAIFHPDSELVKS